MSKSEVNGLKAENDGALSDFISALSADPLGTTRKATSDAFPVGCGHTTVEKS